MTQKVRRRDERYFSLPSVPTYRKILTTYPNIAGFFYPESYNGLVRLIWEDEMRVRIEMTDEGSDEVVIHCRKITPEIEELVHRIGQRDKSRAQLTFFKGEEQYYPSLDEILFFETENERVYAHTCKDSFEIRQSLRELSTILPNYFVRISKSTIANILHIFSMQKGIARVCHVTFRGTHKEVYVSRMYANVLKEKMEERHLYEKT